MSPPSPEPESSPTTLLGAGSFARVYAYEHFAWKVVRREGEDNAVLCDEFRQLKYLDKKCAGDVSSLTPYRFSLPRVHAYLNPLTEELRLRSWTLPVHDIDSYAEFRSNFEVFRDMHPKCAVFCMDLVHNISANVAHRIQSVLCPQKPLASQPMPAICKLHLGTNESSHKASLSSSPTRSIQHPHPLLHEDYILNRYALRKLSDVAVLPPPTIIAENMGFLLSSLHWVGRVDARGIKYVLAGSSSAFGAISFYAFDLDQSSPFTLQQSSTAPLADRVKGIFEKLGRAFLDNNPYCPKARLGDPVYRAFREGYLSREHACEEEAKLFLRVVEAVQGERDHRESGIEESEQEEEGVAGREWGSESMNEIMPSLETLLGSL